MQKPKYDTAQQVLSKLEVKSDRQEEIRAWQSFGFTFFAVCGLKLISLYV